MRTIRGKVLLSLFVAMLITVSITVVLFVRLIDDILVNQVKAQLHGQAEKAVRILEDGDLARLNSTEFKYVVKGELLYAHYFILDADNHIIDSSNPGETGTVLQHLPFSRKSDLKHQGHIPAQEGIAMMHGKKILYTDEVLPGLPYHIFVYSPLSSLRALYVPLMKTTLLSTGASFLLILIIGLLVVSRMVRPLKQLKEAVGRFEPYRSESDDFPEADKTEIGELISTFHSMSGRIQQHHRNQIEFLQNVSHELRTPLMSIQGYVYAIQDQVVSQEEGLKIITAQSQRLVDMVEKLLQLSRLEAIDESWPISVIDLKSMVQDAVHLLMPVANDRHIVLHVEGDLLHVAVPAEHLFRVMINLLQNALRHAAHEVIVRLEPGLSHDIVWKIHVDDDGEGLTEEEEEAVFQRFYTGVNGVTGLGLAICRQIAARLNGDLVYTRSPMGGARFSFIQYAEGRS